MPASIDVINENYLLVIVKKRKFEMKNEE